MLLEADDRTLPPPCSTPLSSHTRMQNHTRKPCHAIPPAANGRTVRSLAYVLSMYENVKMYFVAPDVVRAVARGVGADLSKACQSRPGVRVRPQDRGSPHTHTHRPFPIAWQVRMKDDIKEYLTGVGVQWEEVDDLSVGCAWPGAGVGWGAAQPGLQWAGDPPSSRYAALARAHTPCLALGSVPCCG